MLKKIINKNKEAKNNTLTYNTTKATFILKIVPLYFLGDQFFFLSA
jgi:hypothetical protein